MKLIYIMRHPIDRIISHYKFSCERGYAQGSINDDVMDLPVYLNTSKYFYQIKPYIERFGAENVKLILFEDYLKNPETIVHSVIDFLGLKTFPIPEKLYHSNKSGAGHIHHKNYDAPVTLIAKLSKALYILKKRVIPSAKLEVALSDSVRSNLLGLLKEDIEQLEQLVGKDLSHWKH